MNRRFFAGFGLAAVGGIFVPQFGRWFQRVNEPKMSVLTLSTTGVFAPTDFAIVAISWRNPDGSYTGRQYPCVTRGDIVTVDWASSGEYQPFTIDRV